MVENREKAFNNISRSLAITKYDIEHRQSINDYGLNIHSENFFRDILNFIYGYTLENANYKSHNTPYIDLVDKKRKLFFQVTTTRTKEKIEKSLQILKDPKYTSYTIKILYLLEKSKPERSTVEELNIKYRIDLIDCLYDSSDLIREINNLPTEKLIDLNHKYFHNIMDKYAEVQILDLVIKHLIQGKKKIKINYNDEDFGSIDSNEKIKINKLNTRIAAELNRALDYRSLLEQLDKEDCTLTELREFVVDGLYKTILENKLLAKARREELIGKNVGQLHSLAKLHNLDFNVMISTLHDQIEANIDIDNFNSTNISWIIIAFFFEICDVGVKE
jgi:hypothetical protein